MSSSSVGKVTRLDRIEFQSSDGLRSFSLDSLGFLYCNGGLVKLQRKTRRVLVVLAKAGTVVKKNELREKVWPEKKDVSDGAIAYQIKALRKALGGGTTDETYIRTVHGDGYVFEPPKLISCPSSGVGTVDHTPPPTSPPVGEEAASTDPLAEKTIDVQIRSFGTRVAELEGLLNREIGDKRVLANELDLAIERETEFRRSVVIAGATLLVLGLLALIVIVLVVPSSPPPSSAAPIVAAPADTPALKTLWHGFLSRPEAEKPLVVFSNNRFVGHPLTGLQYPSETEVNDAHLFDQYTGVGEVQAVIYLKDLFSPFGRNIVATRAEQYSQPQAQSQDLIFVGGTAENLKLRPILTAVENLQYFRFNRDKAGDREGDLAIQLVPLKRGWYPEPRAAANSRDLSKDYAIVALLPNVTVTGRNLMLLAGTGTFGTQAATRFATSEQSADALLKTLGVPVGASDMPFFEAVICVDIALGEPSERTDRNSVVAWRRIPDSNQGTKPQWLENIRANAHGLVIDPSDHCPSPEKQ